jgi:hypothetical protein
MTKPASCGLLAVSEEIFSLPGTAWWDRENSHDLAISITYTVKLS